MGVSEKIRRKNACSRCSWQKLKSWWGKDTDQKYQCEIFNCVDLCRGVQALCGRPQPEHESVMPLLSLSPLNVLTH